MRGSDNSRISGPSEQVGRHISMHDSQNSEQVGRRISMHDSQISGPSEQVDRRNSKLPCSGTPHRHPLFTAANPLRRPIPVCSTSQVC